MSTSLAERPKTSRFIRARQRLNDLSIGRKMSFGFGTMALLIGSLVILTYLASVRARNSLARVAEERLPSALNALVLELEMHEMISHVQGYLTLGDTGHRESFENDTKEVEELLHELKLLADRWGELGASNRLAKLDTMFHDWLIVVETMFDLHDNPIENQPAIRILSQEARPIETEILSHTTDLIERQALRSPSADNMRLLKVMADFQSSFNLMTTALDGYVATVELDSKALFIDTLVKNDTAWESLNQARGELTAEQQLALASLSSSREQFLSLPDRMFAAVEGEHAREDLYFLRSQAVPLADEIVAQFNEIRSDQLRLLAQDIDAGNGSLSMARTQTIFGAAILLIVAAFVAFAVRRNITGPIARLTAVTAQIMQGDLNATARTESKDEIGRLAISLNDMTGRLRETLFQAEQRARVIEISSRVSQRLSTILDEEQLAEAVVEQLQSAFGFSHAHLFLCEGAGQNLLLVSGSGQAGQELVANGFQISFGQGLVGRAAMSNNPVLIADVQQDEGFLAHPLLADTKSELAIPIAIGDQVLGVLDVQHDIAGGLTQIDVDLLQSIASQVAITLRNARSYAESQRRADQERVINDISQKILGASTVDRAMQIAVRELGRSVGAPTATVFLANENSS